MGDPVCKANIRRVTFCAALLMGTAIVGQERAESAEPWCPPQSPSNGLLNRMGLYDLSAAIDAPFQRQPCEPGDIPLTPWDRAPRSGSLCDRWQAHHEEKKAWHYYIRGVGPAVHERSPSRPCWW